ncbi:retrovirus-related pol polyprotein from transposon TNT 1-94 [Tanacetum coccineum]
MDSLRGLCEFASKENGKKVHPRLVDITLSCHNMGEFLFLASKDEAPGFIIKFLKMIQVRLNTPVRNIRADNGTEFVNQTLRSYYESVGISHETSVAQSPEQNGFVERKPDLSYLHVFGALCYPNNDSEDLGKLQAKAHIGIFIRYTPKKKAYRIYIRRPELQFMTHVTSSSGRVLNPIPQQPSVSSVLVIDASRAVDLADSPVSMSIHQDAL